ncbi:MAG: acyltransferase, partial [Arenicellales bacterium]
MGVVLYHLKGNFAFQHPGQNLGWVGRLWGEGAFGVPLFFAISGFIIARPFLRHKSVSIKRYMLRRLSRLEPPYFINLIFVFALKVWILGIAASQLWPHLVASMAYSHNIWYGGESLVNGVAWSLEVEWQFYVTAPLIFALTIRPRPRWFVIWMLVVLGGLMHSLSPMYSTEVVLSLLHYFGFFIGGVWAAAVIENGSLNLHPIVYDLIWIGTSLAMLLILTGSIHFGDLPGAGQPYSYMLLPMLSGFTVLGAMNGKVAQAVLGWWPIYIIGGMCYTVYLYHFFVISAMSHVVGLAPNWFG